ncbi:related to MRPL24 - mitochondrial ribosomal protein, large subunit [Melanopsichium pennsylvanicum]|uniref:Large ribosomal subunit protein bL28c n=2 Tax=Melanopsichium pennsylvanicum TaxID=63383 RepID=A0AAJ4XJ03_9BASI|nr:related to MRPL24-mitochondrial ribosomal protein, large subunit [Melanopsichium pennsylvanicum 4]SNX83272.1 related to MRPL24 - mitochondrial ribosomal protein, large subunit [Melanopsichium pennsylvanicum]
MFFTAIRLGSRTTYRGSRGSGAGASTRTSAFSSPKSRNAAAVSLESGTIFKRSQRGLYDGKIIQSGHNVPKSRQKTARTWAPNIQTKRLWSETLNRFIQAKVATSALRTMDKLGGLDRYLAKTKDAKLGEWGKNLRHKLAWRLKKNRLGAERQALLVDEQQPQAKTTST